MDMVEAVGPEFCGRANARFPALEELYFLNMDRWVTWELAVERWGLFPRLHYLSVSGCPKLKSMAPLHLLPALETLYIESCLELTSIELWGGPSSVGLPSLRQMSIIRCPQARFSPEDNEHLLLPSTLQHLFWDSPLLVEWCERGGGTRLAHIPNAEVRSLGNGVKWVSTSLLKQSPTRKEIR